jgi:hypothetical protein
MLSFPSLSNWAWDRASRPATFLAYWRLFFAEISGETPFPKPRYLLLFFRHRNASFSLFHRTLCIGRLPSPGIRATPFPPAPAWADFGHRFLPPIPRACGPDSFYVRQRRAASVAQCAGVVKQ